MVNLTIEQIEEQHEKLRNILISFGCKEYGDCIIDEISNLFKFPNTHFLENKFKL